MTKCDRAAAFDDTIVGMCETGQQVATTTIISMKYHHTIVKWANTRRSWEGLTMGLVKEVWDMEL